MPADAGCKQRLLWVYVRPRKEVYEGGEERLGVITANQTEEWAEAHSSVALPLDSRLRHHPTFMICQAVWVVSASLDALPSASEFAHWFAELGPA
jgi:hypothetical protein